MVAPPGVISPRAQPHRKLAEGFKLSRRDNAQQVDHWENHSEAHRHSTFVATRGFASNGFKQGSSQSCSTRE